VDTTAAAWKTIDNMFKTVARSKVQHLCSELNDTKKLQMSADEYYTKKKGFASEIVVVGKALDDDELIGYMLRGLEVDHYNAQITNINGKPETTLDEFYSQLSAYDMRNTPKESPKGFTSSGNHARRGGDDRDGRYRGARDGRSPERGHGGGGGGWSRDRRDCRDGPWRRDDTRPQQDGGGDCPRHRDDDDSRRTDGGKGRRRSDRAPTPFVDTTCQICTIHATMLRIVGGAMRMMMIVASRAIGVQTLHPMV
jgi:hypothetical protein